MKFGLIGYPLSHSVSKYIHEAGFRSLGVDAVYDILETNPEDLVDMTKYLKRNDYNGFNVTIPLKLPISLFMQEVDKYADIVAAVNTVKINDDKTFKGYNTDALGFRKAIPNTVKLKDESVAILGTGGACRAAILGLSDLGVKEIGIYTRNIPNALDFMSYVRRKFPQIVFTAYQIDAIRDLSKYKMLVNSTPIGMLSHSADMSPVDEKILATMKENSVVYDIIYNPKKTILLKNAEKLGYKTINGLDMLIYQAISAQEIWLGKTPDFNEMKIAALENL